MWRTQCPGQNLTGWAMDAAELPAERRRSYTRTVWSLAPTTNCHGRAPLQWMEFSSIAVLYCRCMRVL